MADSVRSPLNTLYKELQASFVTGTFLRLVNVCCSLTAVSPTLREIYCRNVRIYHQVYRNREFSVSRSITVAIILLLP